MTNALPSLMNNKSNPKRNLTVTMLRPNVLALALMTAMGLPQAVHASATETSESGVQGSSALGMYREGLIDPEGNLTDPGEPRSRLAQLFLNVSL